jgi:hypothetical protein
MSGAGVQSADLITTLSATQSCTQAATGEILLHDRAVAQPWTLLHLDGAHSGASFGYDLQPGL